MTYPWPNVDMPLLRRERTARVVALMKELELDHLLLTSFDNIRYATDYRTQIIAEAFDWFAAVIDADGAAELFVPWQDESSEGADEETPSVRAIHPLPSWTPSGPHAQFWITSLSSTLKGAKRIGYEMVDPAIGTGLAASLPDTKWIPVSAALHDVRLVKHPIELELLEHASRVNAAAANAALTGARAGMTDFDILAGIMGELQEQGVEFLSHSLCNHRRGSGTWFAQGTELREGDPFFFDVGCYGPGGYASDIARSGFVGDPPAEAVRAWNTLLDAFEKGQEMARPGTRVSQVHEAINEHLRSAGLPITPYSMGHGVGLRACELPTIHRADRMDRDQVLAVGNVISLEPETAIELDGDTIILKIEDNFAVESDGLRLLSTPSQARLPLGS